MSFLIAGAQLPSGTPLRHQSPERIAQVRSYLLVLSLDRLDFTCVLYDRVYPLLTRFPSSRGNLPCVPNKLEGLQLSKGLLQISAYGSI